MNLTAVFSQLSQISGLNIFRFNPRGDFISFREGPSINYAFDRPSLLVGKYLFQAETSNSRLHGYNEDFFHSEHNVQETTTVLNAKFNSLINGFRSFI